MAAIDFNPAIYYTISEGKICRQFKQPNEKTVSRTNKNGKLVHEQFHSALKGYITGIETKDSEYGKFWMVTLTDKNNEKEVLQFQYSSGYANGFLRCLPNVDFTKEVVLIPNMKVEGEKKKTTMFLSQDGKPIKWYYTMEHANGIPELKQIKVKGKATWDDSDIMEFLESMVKEKILPQIKNPQPKAIDPEPEYAEVLPFENEKEEEAPF